MQVHIHMNLVSQSRMRIINSFEWNVLHHCFKAALAARAGHRRSNRSCHLSVVNIVTSWYPKRLFRRNPKHLLLHARAGVVLARVTIVLAGGLLQTRVVLLVTSDGVVGNAAQSIFCLACGAASIACCRLTERSAARRDAGLLAT
jgi:hypothetical protein